MKIQILGNGRIAGAIRHFISQTDLDVCLATDLLPNCPLPKETDLIISTLPGGLGGQGLDMALAQKTHLIDLADLDDVFYMEQAEKIDKAGITVMPGCGFCPGLVNFIIGHELGTHGPGINFKSVEIKTGSLSPQQFYFPFLWCFEDQVPEFTDPSIQIIKGKQESFPAFSGLKEEILWGIPAETYLAQSGFENFARNSGIPKFTYRNIRPRGFRIFFEYLVQHGCFETQNIAATKQLLESKVLDNYSISEILMTSATKKYNWKIKSASNQTAPFNSMQKITALFAIEILKCFIEGKIRHNGLVLNETMGRDDTIFRSVIKGLRTQAIDIDFNHKPSG